MRTLLRTRTRSDTELAERVRVGDGDALAEVYDRYGAACFGLARRILGDATLAEDVVQEVFVTYWRQAERYDDRRARLATWLLTLTHRRAVDAVRREQVHSGRRLPLAVLQEARDPGPGVAESGEAAVQAEQVRQALARLPEPQREALVLAYYGGYTQREIAGLLGVPLGTVKTRMFTGMSRLRSVLPDVLDDEGREP